MNHKCVSLRVAAGVLVTLTALPALAGNTQLPGSVIPAISNATVVGTPSSAKTVYFTLSLQPQYPAEMHAYADAVSDPRSESFHKWLTPSQIGEQFGASASTVSTVVSYLKSQGITIALQSPTRLALNCKGTVAQVQKAFSTTIKDYRGPDVLGNTITFEANSTPLSVPSAWANKVLAISGVENWTRPYPLAQTNSLNPTLFRALYSLKPNYDLGFTGNGATIGVSNWDGFSISQNVPLFVNAFGLPLPPGGAGSNCKVVTVQGGSQGNPPGGEGDLDIQMELMATPLATVMVYDGGGDELSVLNQELSDNKCDIISESWIWNYASSPSTAQAGDNLHVGMTIAGITYMTATGDDGTGTYTRFSGGFPQCDPEVLGVGGTTATVDSLTGARINEISWSGSGAGGGGWVAVNYGFNKRPAWQHGPGIPNQPNFRVQPDIAIHAGNPSFTCYAFYSGGAAAGANGTSFASPANASAMAAVECALFNAGAGRRLGRIQDLIYLQQGRSDAWHDITQGDIGPLPDGNEATARAGWDFASGWGAPIYLGLFNSLLSQTVATPYPPDSVSTDLGTYIIGDQTSLTSNDSIAYQIGSAGVPQFGQAAELSASFTIPVDASFIAIDLRATGGNVGGTNMVWLLNWFTGNWDLIGSTPLDSAVTNDRVIKVRATDVSNYIGPGGEVDMELRAHFPIKPFNNALPLPFTYKVDQLQLLVR